MKDLIEIKEESKLSFTDIKKEYKTEYNLVFDREKNWLNNLEEKTSRLPSNVKSDIDFVISNLKNLNYEFSSTDTYKLSTFVSQINRITRIANRINNFKEGVILNNENKLSLHNLFNAIKKTDKLVNLNFELNKNLNAFIPHLFSVVKHCQYPDNYPIYYRYWKNILGEILKENDDYDSLCDFYQKIEDPKHLSLGAYFGAIGIILAKKITENKIIKEEGDKNYNYIKNKLLNIHYFDLIEGYNRKPNYFIVGSKYGEKNDQDVFPEMKMKSVVSVGFASDIDLTEFYLTDENEIIEYLKEENQNQNAINALKHFLKIKIGDKVAIKASGSPKGNKGFLSISGICEVVANENGEIYNYEPEGLGHTLNVKYLSTNYREYELGGYGMTVHKLSNEEHINLLFNHLDDEHFDNDISKVAEPTVSYKNRVHNKLAQAICVIGDSGVGKTYRINKTLEKEGHKTLFIIVDNMWQHLLFDYSPIDRKYYLTKVGAFIRKSYEDPAQNYTIVIDECHKNLEIINDVLLQAISTKRNDGKRFLSLNSLVDKEFEFLPEINGNRLLPSNLGFIFISSKSDIIEGNDDLKNRIEIIGLTESDQENKDFSVDFLLSKIVKEDQSEYTN